MIRKTQLDAVLARHPRDAQLRLGYAVIAANRQQMRALLSYTPHTQQFASVIPEAGWKPGFAFRQALSLGHEVSAQFLYATYLLSTWASPPQYAGAIAQGRPRPLTAGAIIKNLAARDPDNAMVYYLAADVSLAHGDDATAWQELARGNRCQHSSVYATQAAAAAERLLRVAGESPLMAPAEALQAEDAAAMDATTPLGAVARAASLQASKANKRGQYDLACSFVRSVLAMSRMVRVNATTTLEVMAADHITSQAISPLLPATSTPPAAATSQSAQSAAQSRLARAQAFARYAATHGAADLGQQAVAQVKNDNRVMQMIRGRYLVPSGRTGIVALQSLSLLPSAMAPLAAGIVLSLLLLGVARLRGRAPHAAPMPVTSWLISLLALVLAPLAVGGCLGLPQPSGEAVKGLFMQIGEVVTVLAALPWLVTGVLAARAARSSVAADNQPVSTTATLALSAVPLLAAMVLLVLALLLVMGVGMAAHNHLALEMVRQGELHALGISPK